MAKSVYTQNYELLKQLLISHRKKIGMTQEELAKALGKHQSYVSKCESGERRIDLIEFLDLARIMKINVQQFIKNLISGKRE